MLFGCEGGVRALALTPRGDFGDLRFVQGFKARFETLARIGPHSGTTFSSPGDGIRLNFISRLMYDVHRSYFKIFDCEEFYL
ncbi:hypothetical protein CPR19088_GLDEOEPO_02293 [Companilactobacillus paralimentarius]|nr:hypothetical protein LNA01_17490 [Companilactobacillus nantensis]